MASSPQPSPPGGIQAEEREEHTSELACYRPRGFNPLLEFVSISVHWWFAAAWIPLSGYDPFETDRSHVGDFFRPGFSAKTCNCCTKATFNFLR
jgi:hypothetical protein